MHKARFKYILMGSLLLLTACQSDRVVDMGDGTVQVIRPSQPAKQTNPADPQEKNRPKAPLKVRVLHESFQLPMRTSALIAEGWTLDDRFKAEGAASGTYHPGIIFHKDGQVLRAIVGNPGQDAMRPYLQGMIIGLDLLPRTDGPANGFVIPGVAYQGMSQDQLQKRLGKPLKKGKWGQDYESWFYQLPQGDCLFTLDKGLVVGARIHQFPDHSQGGDHLDEMFWGEDPTTGRIIIDGDFFRLPGKLDHFHRSGWRIIRGPEKLKAKSDRQLTLAKGRYRLLITMANLTGKDQPVEKGRVVAVRALKPNLSPSMRLTKTLKTGLSDAEVFAFIRIYGPDKGEVGNNYYYSIKRRDYNIRFAIDMAQDRLATIEYERWYFPWEEGEDLNPSPHLELDNPLEMPPSPKLPGSGADSRKDKDRKDKEDSEDNQGSKNKKDKTKELEEKSPKD